MRKLLLPILLVLGITFSCSKENESEVVTSNKILTVSGAEIATRTSDDGSGGEEEADTSFEVGDKITVVGATEDDVTFIYKSDGSWLAEGTYEWIDNPQTVKAYYGQDTFISDGDQMPDLLVATYECNGEIPETLSFTDETAFTHATAMIEVIIRDWSSIVDPSVKFQNCHNVVAVGSNGVYYTDDNCIYTINFELYSEVEQADGKKTFSFRACVPAGSEENTYILADSQSLLFGDSSALINIFTFIADEDDIPSYYEGGKIFTYDITYVSN